MALGIKEHPLFWIVGLCAVVASSAVATTSFFFNKIIVIKEETHKMTIANLENQINDLKKINIDSAKFNQGLTKTNQDLTKELSKCTDDVEMPATLAPDVSGSWLRPGDNLQLHIIQNLDQFSSTIPNHFITGRYNAAENAFEYKVNRTFNGCTTIMRGKLFKIDNSQIRTLISSSDGRCDLPTNFQEDSYWNKI
ncbi:MAG: hypothetical protein AB2705_21975 [Candidatus Thiodiazotropha sp.]